MSKAHVGFGARAVRVLVAAGVLALGSFGMGWDGCGGSASATHPDGGTCIWNSPHPGGFPCGSTCNDDCQSGVCGTSAGVLSLSPYICCDYDAPQGLGSPCVCAGDCVSDTPYELAFKPDAIECFAGTCVCKPGVTSRLCPATASSSSTTESPTGTSTETTSPTTATTTSPDTTTSANTTTTSSPETTTSSPTTTTPQTTIPSTTTSSSSDEVDGGRVECCYIWDSSTCLQSTGSNGACSCDGYPPGTDCSTIYTPTGATIVPSCTTQTCCWNHIDDPDDCSCYSNAACTSCYTTCEQWLAGLNAGGNTQTVGSCPGA
jgi:hypothetical protein